jgi:cytochrome c2
LLGFWLKETERRVRARERLNYRQTAAARAPIALAFFLFVSFLFTACDDPRPVAMALSAGSPQKGKEAIRKYGCWTCHTIPGIEGANAVIGPPLTMIANRAYVAGHPNGPEHLIRWIRHPQEVRSPTPMPDMGVSEEDARDIVAYLYTLR